MTPVTHITQSTTPGDSPRHALFSPEGVHLDLPVAGPAPRIFAYALDFVVIVLLMLLLAIVLFTLIPIGAALDRWWSVFFHDNAVAASSGTVSPSLGNAVGLFIAIFVLAQFLIETGYFIFWEMVTNGRSPGKALVGLRVVCRDGLPINGRSSVIRNLMRIADLLPANYFVGLISMVLSPGCERIGDHAAGTLVVRLDRPEPAPEIIFAGDLAPIPFTRQQLARIGPRELQLLRGTLRRIAQLPPDRTPAAAGQDQIHDRTGNRTQNSTETRTPTQNRPQNLTTDEFLAEKDELLPGNDELLVGKDQFLAEKDPLPAEKAPLPAEKAQLLAEVAESMRLRMGLPALPSADPLEFLQSLLRSADRFRR